VTQNPILPSGAQPAPDPMRLPPRAVRDTGAPSVRPTDPPAAHPAAAPVPTDSVSLSDGARLLVRRVEGGSPEGELQLSPERLHEVSKRVAEDGYDRPEVRREVARRIIALDVGI
jgi:hypothetical protein